MIDDGYIKYNCNWKKQAINVPDEVLKNLNEFRSKLVQKNMIGKIPDGPGFGNISVRFNHGFLITGSNTGHLTELTASDLAFVNKVDVKYNSLWCIGESIASSESMTHAVIYQQANAVIHIHCKSLWQKFLFRFPTTSTEFSFGTPEMANAIKKLIKLHPNELIVLGGHEDGIIVYGNTLSEAYDKIRKY
ncbi:MAG: class II aldolase/adducin family protein [Salinivirgaceae bacterium]|nr:class II aldolase/adducin family protein [Salinivirgaceae bacterium]